MISAHPRTSAVIGLVIIAIIGLLALVGFAGARRGADSTHQALPLASADPLAQRYRDVHPSIAFFKVSVPSDDPKAPGTWDDAWGSGFVVQSGAWGSRLLTARHVIDGSRATTVVIADRGQPLRARVIGISNARIKVEDDPIDLALVEIAQPHLPALVLAQPDEIVPGAPVALLGYPVPDYFVDEGLERTASLYSGHIASVRRGALELDMPIVEGESGGPVLSVTTGRVVGMVESRFDDQPAIGFATPVTMMRDFLARFSMPT